MTDDLISRQQAVDALSKYVDYSDDGEQEINADCVFHTLEELPSAEPERKTGRWIPHSEGITYGLGGESYTGGVICSECGFKTHNKLHLLFGCPYNFCPNCGSPMEVGHEAKNDG